MRINFKSSLLSMLFVLLCLQLQAQKNYFTVRGAVVKKYTDDPVSEVTIEVNGGLYEETGFDGYFKIRVKIGDIVAIKHKEFQTVYHTITSDDRLRIEVLPESSTKTTYNQRSSSVQLFNQLIDSADTYLKKDAEKSIKFIADALDKSVSQSQNAEAYTTLGDLYMYWKQYDFAVSNYKIALQNGSDNEIKLKLAKAYEANKELSQSIKIYSAINENNLSNYQRITRYEGLGDVHLKNKKDALAITNYEQGLEVAKSSKIKSKITDLQSKIAQAYNVKGEAQKAKKLFDSSLELAEQESKTRGIQEKETVAEFNNTNRNYNDEITLRKQVVNDVKEIEKDSIISNESPLTPQKQNYKIGNALVLQKNYTEAIPYYEESIIEADKREDLEVKKDAQRRKADAYESLGDFDNAKATFQQFMITVDSIYAKKQQQISQSARLSHSILESQNRIASLENERELSLSRYQYTEEKSKNQQITIYALIGGLLLLLIAGFFTYKYIKEQRLANNLLALKSLRSQMNPHFIFNALNSVNSFIALNDERTANKYLSDFSFLMRAVLENSEEDFIPLKKEIELLELYTKLEHFRFKDKFDYMIEVDDDIDVDDYEIPPMLLQPYIENAVWHGLRYKNEKGILKITITPISNNEIAIAIMDDGIGRDKSKALKTDNQKKHNSKGLSNIKKRIEILNNMYKDKVDVSINDFKAKGDVGTKVVVTLKKD